LLRVLARAATPIAVPTKAQKICCVYKRLGTPAAIPPIMDIDSIDMSIFAVVSRKVVRETEWVEEFPLRKLQIIQGRRYRESQLQVSFLWVGFNMRMPQ
jgi:hypothetical protein